MGKVKTIQLSGTNAAVKALTTLTDSEAKKLKKQIAKVGTKTVLAANIGISVFALMRVEKNGTGSAPTIYLIREFLKDN